MKKDEIIPKAYVQELEDKLFDLSFKLKNKKNELAYVQFVNKKLLGKLSHNLKNPVGVIFSFSEMMLADIDNYTTEKLTKHLKIIKNSSEFSLNFLNAVNNYVRLQACDFEMNFEEVKYLDFLQNIVKNFESEAKEKNITIKTNFPSAEILAFIDKDELSEMLNNVLNNAIRFTNPYKTITISVNENKNNVITEIRDEGIGISSKDLPYIFDEFYVVNTYSEDKQKCIGLGLSAVKKIVELHFGKIEVESEEHMGSTFKITIPKLQKMSFERSKKLV